MSIQISNRARRASHPAQGRSTGGHRIAARVALGIAGGLLVSLAIYLGHPSAPGPATVAPPADRASQTATASPIHLPRMVLTGIVRAADAAQSYALISLAGSPARAFRTGDQVAEGVQLIDIASGDVTLVSQGTMLRLAIEKPLESSPPDQKTAARTPNDWRSAASTRSIKEPVGTPVAIVAPARGFDAASSTGVDRAVWRSRQNADAP